MPSFLSNITSRINSDKVTYAEGAPAAAPRADFDCFDSENQWDRMSGIEVAFDSLISDRVLTV